LVKKNLSDVVAYFKPKQFEKNILSKIRMQLADAHVGTYRKADGTTQRYDVRAGPFIVDNTLYVCISLWSVGSYDVNDFVFSKIDWEQLRNEAGKRWLADLSDANDQLKVEIDRRVTAENELEELNKHLEERVAQRTAELEAVNKSLTARIAQLDFLNRTTFELAATIDLETLLPAVRALFLSRFSHATAAVCFRGNGTEFKCIDAAGALDSTAGRTTVARVCNNFASTGTKELQHYTHVKDVPGFDGRSWPLNVDEYPACCIAPFVADMKIVGALVLFSSKEGFAVFKEERLVFKTLTSHISICLSNALHIKELSKRERIEGELAAARRIQRSIIPRTQPSIPGIDLSATYIPASEVGGDYIDYFPTGNGRWVVVIADVCGKGVPASLLMTILRCAFRFKASGFPSSRDLLCAVNEAVVPSIDERSFITALCLSIDPGNRSVRIARAGHPGVIHLTQAGSLTHIEPDGFALGLAHNAAAFRKALEEVELTLCEGDKLVLYTDGVTETIDRNHSIYGYKRLEKVLYSSGTSSSEQTILSIIESVEQFRDGFEVSDDLTICSMRIRPPEL
jgi:sigma-B regulation protein RsbU (phosphoserine phosphatase)